VQISDPMMPGVALAHVARQCSHSFIRYPRLNASGEGGGMGARLPTYPGWESANATVENDRIIANQRHHVEMIGSRMVNGGFLLIDRPPAIREGRLSSLGIS